MRTRFIRMAASMVLALCACALLAGAIAAPADVLNNSNELLAADLPIIYGDASFRQRILERTKGERDPIGLVLSGGSARAFAHLGVLKYLEEQGIVPDFIVSNSMGSIVGLLYAAGLSPDQIVSLCSEVDMGQLFDLTLPVKGGVLDTTRFSAIIEAFLGEQRRIEDFPLPVMVVAEDMATKRQVLITEGDLVTILEASFVLPVYFSPVEYNGHLLLDGGISNLVPLSIAYGYSNTIVVSTTFYEGKNINLRNSVSILNVAMDIGKRRQGVVELLEHPDALWVRCDVEDYSFMDFASMPAIAAKGYESAKKMADRLSVLPAGGIDGEVLAVRESYAEKEAWVLGNYRLFNRVNQRLLSQQVFVGLQSYHYDGDPWILKEDNIVGLQYDLRWRDFDFSLDAGLGWAASAGMSLYPSALASLGINLLPFMMTYVDVGITWDSGWLPSYYNRTGLLAKQLFLDERLELQASAMLENQLGPNFRLSGMLLSAGGSALWSNTQGYPFTVSLSGGWQLAHAYDRQFIYAKVRSDFPLPSDFSLKASFNGRFALDGDGEVPFYLSDQFRTNDAVIRSQGSLAPLGPLNTSNHLYTARLDAAWSPASFKPTIGEMLIFNDTQIGLFVGMLWNSSTQIFPNVSVGLELSSQLSLLGLKGMTISTYAGYDQLSNDIVWGFIFGG